MLEVRIRGLRFVGQSDGEGEVYLIKPDGFTGWDDGVDMRREDIPLPSAHGSFDLPGFLTPRVPAWSGEFWAPTPKRFEHMRDRLTGLLADGDMGRLVVEQDRGEQWANVRRVKVTVNENQDMVSARYQVQVWAPDPRKYGEVRTFAGGRPAFHYGNFPATPRLKITGSASGYTVTGPGDRRITVTKPLTAGGHEIDLATGALLIDGVRVLGGLTRFEPWTIPPGQQVTATTSAGTLTVSVRDTYI